MLAAAILAGTAIGSHAVIASDHDDGTTDKKTLNTNLTDLFVFNEATHKGEALAGNTDVVLVMNVNPRSLPQQQYYFNTEALYEFNVHRLTDTTTVNANIPEAEEDVDLTLRVQFGAPDTTTNKQAITLTKLPTGATSSVVTTGTQTTAATDAALGTGNLTTTPHAMVAELPETGVAGLRATYTGDTAIKNTATLDGDTVEVFAGLREDPFFFDVERFFKVRAALVRGELDTTFVNADATDFTAGYNVLSIVLKVPRALLAGTSGATTFDVWETIKVRS